MDKELEIEALKLQKIKVGAARAEMEFSKKQKMSEIKRIDDNVKIQLARESDLQTQIDAAEAALKQA